MTLLLILKVMLIAILVLVGIILMLFWGCLVGCYIEYVLSEYDWRKK